MPVYARDGIPFRETSGRTPDGKCVAQFWESTVFRLFFILFAALHDQSGQCDQTNDVRNDHELVKGVGQFPYEVVGEQRTEEDKEDRDDGVDEICLFAKDIHDVDPTEEVPADDG